MENPIGKKLTIANVITAGRIVCSILLLCVPAFSIHFYIFYTAAGLTDMIDGPVARKTGMASEFGAKLDSAADLIFVVACIIKILPAVKWPIWILIWVGIIVVIRIVKAVIRYKKYRRLEPEHTVMNKICGGVAFAVPFLLGLNVGWQGKLSGVVIACVVATVGAVCRC